jgi:uncharacterized protein YjiS (DUF1127 family)
MHTMNGHNGASLSRHVIIATELSAHKTIPVASQFAMEFARLVARWSHRARSRRELANLEPRLLIDIGLSREAALKEAEKPFWR